jgi:hypothetical protein
LTAWAGGTEGVGASQMKLCRRPSRQSCDVQVAHELFPNVQYRVASEISEVA